MNKTEPKRYTEEQLGKMSRLDLVEIVRHWSIHTKTPMHDMLPRGAKKDFVLELVLELQETKGGS